MGYRPIVRRFQALIQLLRASFRANQDHRPADRYCGLTSDEGDSYHIPNNIGSLESGVGVRVKNGYSIVTRIEPTGARGKVPTNPYGNRD